MHTDANQAQSRPYKWEWVHARLHTDVNASSANVYDIIYNDNMYVYVIYM